MNKTFAIAMIFISYMSIFITGIWMVIELVFGNEFNWWSVRTFLLSFFLLFASMGLITIFAKKGKK